MNETIEKFGYPGSLLKEFDHWVVLIRPGQVTLGSLVLAAKSDATRFSDLAPEAFAELKTITTSIEDGLGAAFGPQKYNYMMLMMVDPHVHFHVIPRYDTAQELAGVTISDSGWPALPNLGGAVAADAALMDAIREALRPHFGA